MVELLRFVLLGLAVGALYALTAQGLVLIHKGSGVVNLAQGAVGMVGAYLFYEVGQENEWPAVAAWALTIGGSALIGVATHLVVMRSLRHASPLVRFVATLGLFFVLVAAVHEVWGNEPRTVTSPLPTTTRYPLGGEGGISEDRLWLIALAVVVTAALWAFYRWTPFGQATSAVAENPDAASTLGISPSAIAGVNWALGSALAAVTAVFLAPVLSLSVAALAYVTLRAVAAALVGRFESFWLTLAGAMVIGVLESVIGRYSGDTDLFGFMTSDGGLVFGIFTPQAIARSVGFFVIIAVLVVAGRSLPDRSEMLDRLPVLGTGRLNPKTAVVAIVAVVVALNSGDPDLGSALIVSMSIAIVLLSVVVVTGYVGQVSLTQMGLAGFGAWSAAGLSATHGLPIPLAMVLGVLVTVPLGLVVAIPALRTRGVNLAIVTFGMAVVLEELVFNNPGLNGSLTGHVVGETSFFGITFDAFTHPARYGGLVLVVLVLCGALVANLRRSATGRQMIAVRGNERAAAALGINVVSVKVFAFGVGAGLAAVGGILYAFRQTSVTYKSFDAFASIEALIYVVIGGVGFVIGALIGAAFAIGGLGPHIADALLEMDEITLSLITGAILLLNIVTNPNGFAFSLSHTATMVGRRLGRSRPESAEGEHGALDVASTPAATEGAHGGAKVALATGQLHEHLVGSTLQVDHLTVRFGGVVAVDDVSLTVRAGEVVGLIGANGAGKTTFIDAVTGFVQPSGGTKIRIEDTPIEGLKPADRARAGLGRSFQSLELFEDMTVRDNLLTALDDRHWANALRDMVRGRRGSLSPVAVAAVAQFELADCLDLKPAELSYGKRRLVSVARTIAAGPSVLLLDEPAAGLSETESRELGEVVRLLAHDIGLGVLLVEHDVAMVMSCCDRVAVLDFGAKIADGTPEEVVQLPAVIAAYLGAQPESVDDRPPAAAEIGG